MLLDVRTIAELYGDPATATRGLAFWRGVTRKLSGRHADGVTVAISAFRARVGDGSFAFELTYRQGGQPLYYVGDVVFRTARLLGAVFVSAPDAIGLRTRTHKLADSLASRIKRVLPGRIPSSSVLAPAAAVQPERGRADGDSCTSRVFGLCGSRSISRS